MDKGVTVNHKHESTTLPIESILGQDYRKGEDRIDEIEAEKTKYKFKGNIGDLKDRERYT